jgi:hypothetical protein
MESSDRLWAMGCRTGLVVYGALGALLVSLLIALLPAHHASSQDAITIISDTPRNEFPAGVTFAVSFTAPSPATRVRLRYELAPDGTGASANASCDGAATINCTFTLTSGRDIFIIPGAEITYRWEIEDEDGNELITPDALYVHEDTRFDFRTISAMTPGGYSVTVHFHAGTEDSAPGVLDAAVQTLAEIGALEGTEVAFPVKVFLYETADEMQPAIAPAGGRGVQILGEVVYSDTAMVAADVQALDITRHELAHIVTRAATRGPFGVPGWMNEGIAVHAQNAPLSGHAGALDAAIRNDRLLSMSELSSPATGGVLSTVGLYYGQSGAIVSFLIDTYGAEKFAELMATFRDGSTQDDAFMAVYGLDSLGIENLWRGTLGLPPRFASPTATPAPTEEARAEPTARPAPSGDSAAGDSDGGDGIPVGFIAAAVVLVALLAASGVLLSRVARDRL